MFEGLAQEDLDHLASTLVERRLKGGQMIFDQGDRGSEMYIVAQGHVNIHLPGENSRRVSLKDITVGEYFGELALFDEKPRSASALATTDALLLELSRETLSSYLERRPAPPWPSSAPWASACARPTPCSPSAPPRTPSRRSRSTSPGATSSRTRWPSSTGAGASSCS